MPWFKGINGEVVNAARNKNTAGEGKRAHWVDVGMEIKGVDRWGHIAIFDHPANGGFPQPWRIDGNMGVGPSRAILGDWNIPEGSMEMIRHRFIIYIGDLNDKELMEEWIEYGGEKASWALWDLAQEEGHLLKAISRLVPDSTSMRWLDRQLTLPNSHFLRGLPYRRLQPLPIIPSLHAPLRERPLRVFLLDDRDPHI